MGDANELFQLRPVIVSISRNYVGREEAEIRIMVPDYAKDKTIQTIALDYLNSPQGENIEFEDRSNPVTVSVKPDYQFNIIDDKEG
jgi:hypothetical protein